MELSINMLVIVAMAIFTLFLIVGFVLGGFSYFKGLFGGVSSQPTEVAKINCQRDLLSAQNIYGDNPAPADSRADKNLCQPRDDVDFDGDGKKGDNDPDERTYECGEYVDTNTICGTGGGGGPPI